MQKFTEQTGSLKSLAADLLEPKTILVVQIWSNCEITGCELYVALVTDRMDTSRLVVLRRRKSP